MSKKQVQCEHCHEFFSEHNLHMVHIPKCPERVFTCTACFFPLSYKEKKTHSLACSENIRRQIAELKNRVDTMEDCEIITLLDGSDTRHLFREFMHACVRLCDHFPDTRKRERDASPVRSDKRNFRGVCCKTPDTPATTTTTATATFSSIGEERLFVGSSIGVPAAGPESSEPGRLYGATGIHPEIPDSQYRKTRDF